MRSTRAISDKRAIALTEKAAGRSARASSNLRGVIHGRSAQLTQLVMGRDGLEEAPPQALVANVLGQGVEELEALAKNHFRLNRI